MFNGTYSRAALTVSFFLTFSLVFAYSWVAEDAYITFRVVDHFIQGYGLRWNIDERVQVYTHPLWMLLHILPYYIFDNIFLVTIAIGGICTFAAIRALLQGVRSDYRHLIVLALFPLALSTSFRHYMISGLEVPLSCLLLALFYNSLQRGRLYASLFIASLCILNRFDTILLMAPALLWLVFSERKRLNIPKAFAAFLPIMLWCIFSLVYYGFIFPNTKYAKLNTGVDSFDYARQGFRYLENFLYFDTVGFAVLVFAFIAPAVALWKRRIDIVLPGVGVVLYVLYIVSVGGDFMAGRMWVPPFFVGLIILNRCFTNLSRERLYNAFFFLTTLFFVGQAELSPLFPERSNYHINYGIVAEREVYWETNGLFTLNPFGMRAETTHIWKAAGKEALLKADKNVIGQYCVGVLGFYAASSVVIIDIAALTDPLLARMPIDNPKFWRIGHFYRTFPPGYIYARQTGDTSQMQEPLRSYYEQLRLITSGDLFTAKRWKAILHLHTGAVH